MAQSIKTKILTILEVQKKKFTYKLKYLKLYRHYKSTTVKKYNKTRFLGAQRLICYAPSKSLYFGFNGDVTACCYNRSHVVGHYPENSINDIWEGSELNKLRTHIENEDFSLGCNYCKEQLTSLNFSSFLALNFDYLPLSQYPTLMEFELSTACNLECIMCTPTDIGKARNNPHMTSPYDDAFVEQLIPFIPHLYQAKFFGGEPLIIPVYYKIWEQIVALNPACLTLIQTNATVLTDKAKALFEQGFFEFSVSIDSFKKETYESIRKNANFGKTMENFEYLLNYCRRKRSYIGISVCPIQQNRFELAEIVQKANELNVKVNFNSVWYPESCTLWKWDADKLLETYDYLSSVPLTWETMVQKNNIKHFKDLLNQIYNWYLELK